MTQHLEYFAFGETFLEEHSNTDATPYLFNGKELDEETGLYYYGARYYDAKTSVWASVDPLAEKFPGWSPCAYCLNNPVNMVDPTGMEGEFVNSPIYGRNGKLLGTDDKGLQGKAIVMDEKDFTQGMKHEDALKNNLGVGGLKDDAAKTNLVSSYNSLSSRPDYDGVVTDAEARKQWNSKTGGTLYIDKSKLDLSPLTTKSFDGDKPLQYNFFTSLSSDTRTARVHGTLTMRLKDSTTGEVGFFTDKKGFFDTYDFNGDGRVIRDLTTWGARQIVGEGKGYGFKSYGKNPIVPIK